MACSASKRPTWSARRGPSTPSEPTPSTRTLLRKKPRSQRPDGVKVLRQRPGPLARYGPSSHPPRDERPEHAGGRATSPGTAGSSWPMKSSRCPSRARRPYRSRAADADRLPQDRRRGFRARGDPRSPQPAPRKAGRPDQLEVGERDLRQRRDRAGRDPRRARVAVATGCTRPTPDGQVGARVGAFPTTPFSANFLATPAGR